MKEICIFDLDGVLFDVSRRYSIALERDPDKKSVFWNIFFSEELLKLDIPSREGFNNLRRCLERGFLVYIISGRPERLRNATIRQLEESGLSDVIKNIRIILRRDRDLRRSYVFKLEVLKNLMRKYSVREIHDDDIEFLRRAREILPRDVAVFYYEDNVKTV
ncbi:MAG: hypothetical protein QXJ51_03835 [Sulfolobales archaeon]